MCDEAAFTMLVVSNAPCDATDASVTEFAAGMLCHAI
jgi:hypothetical protein